jgi:uncharacterized membrane protein YtjA (UPF0391 family)
MIRAIFIFLALALFALVLGATGVAGLSMEVARVLIAVFVILTLISVILAIAKGRWPRSP